MMKDLKHLSYEEEVSQMGLFSLLFRKKKGSRGNFIDVSKLKCIEIGK